MKQLLKELSLFVVGILAAFSPLFGEWWLMSWL